MAKEENLYIPFSNRLLGGLPLRFKGEGGQACQKQNVRVTANVGSYLYKIQLELRRILQKLDVIDAKVSRLPHVQVKTSDKLLTTLIALRNIGKPASATEVSMVTGRNRAVESSILNQLCRMGLLEKRRLGKKILFSLSEEASNLFGDGVPNEVEDRRT